MQKETPKGPTKSQPSNPTLDDVAREANVSTATVSRCLNNPSQVVDKTRLRVAEAIKKLEYTPNFGAKAMAAKRTKTIGAVIPTMENSIFAQGLQAFQDTLHTLGYTLLVASSSYNSEIEKDQIHSLVSRGADGLLLIGHDRDASLLHYLKNREIPTLVAWAHDQSATLPSVGFDNFTAMKKLAEMVLKLGHREIGMISAPIASNDRARARVLAVQSVIAKKGLKWNEKRLIETEYGVETGSIAFEKLIGSDKSLTAVFCGNDVLAVGAIKRALSLGIKVPDDVSITGFDDIELGRVILPELTTVKVPHKQMGVNAASTLVKMVEGEEMQPLAPLETRIEFRNSLSRAKN